MPQVGPGPGSLAGKGLVYKTLFTKRSFKVGPQGFKRKNVGEQEQFDF
jgi:hypothetical protein